MHDPQSRLNIMVSPEQEKLLIMACYTLQHQLKLHSISVLNFATTYCQMKQTGQRGHEMTYQTYNFFYSRKMDHLGPSGLVVEHVIANKGKRNQNGNVTTHAIAPHANPLFDTSAHTGLLFIYRHCVMNERLPDFDNYKECFSCPQYRSAKTCTPIKMSTLYTLYKKM